MSKKAIITGSSSGIGYQYAKYLSKQGWYLDLSDYAGQYEKAKDIIKEFEA